MSSNQTATIASSEALGSYKIEFEYKNKIIHSHIIMKDLNKEPVPVTVKIEDYVFTGNYYMPFYKNFTTIYKCTFQTSNMTADNVFTEGKQLGGKVEGTLVPEINPRH